MVVTYYRIREQHVQDRAWHMGTCLVGILICKAGGFWKGLQEEIRKGLICQQSFLILSLGQ